MVGEEEDVKRLFDYINILNPAIEFTYEVSKLKGLNRLPRRNDPP